MSSSNSVTVQILDKEYSIICPPEERNNLVSAARYLDGKMREIRSSGKVIGADRIAVMAALNITHEMLHRQETPATAATGTSAARRAAPTQVLSLDIENTPFGLFARSGLGRIVAVGEGFRITGVDL